MVEQQTREGEVVSSNSAGRVSHGFCAKDAATSMEAGARWSVVASPEKKIRVFLLLFLGFFRIFILPSVNLCRVLFRHSAKASLPINFLPSAALGKAFAECISGFAECRRHSANLEIPVVPVLQCKKRK